jgi:small subunit ribosomal protein S18
MPPRITTGKPNVRCRICRNKTSAPDYKDVQLLQKFCNPQGKIMSRKRSGNCIKHQRQTQKSIKYARFMALLPYIA